MIDELLAEKRKKYDQENMLMRLENLTVLLWPLKGTKGWKEYAAVAKDFACVPSRALERVKISVEIEISVSLCAKQTMANAQCGRQMLTFCFVSVFALVKCEPFRYAQLAPAEDTSGSSKGSIAEAFSP